MKFLPMMFLLMASTSLAAEEEDWIRSAPSGIKTDIIVFLGWKEDCSPRSFTNYLIEKPKHGTVTQGKDTGVIGEVSDEELIDGAYGNCRGKETPTTILRYKSDEDFTGTDQFKIRKEYEDGVSLIQPIIVIVE